MPDAASSFADAQRLLWSEEHRQWSERHKMWFRQMETWKQRRALPAAAAADGERVVETSTATEQPPPRQTLMRDKLNWSAQAAGFASREAELAAQKQQLATRKAQLDALQQEIRRRQDELAAEQAETAAATVQLQTDHRALEQLQNRLQASRMKRRKELQQQAEAERCLAEAQAEFDASGASGSTA